MATTTEAGPAGYMPPETPPGGAAGWWSRVGATILDGLIIAVPLLVGALASNVSGALAGVFGLIYLLALVLYAPVLLVVNEGRTWGKQMADIRVVKKDGSPVGPGAALGRETLKLVFGITGVLWFIDVLWPLWHPENRALHDLAAGTRVITDRGTGG